MFGAVMSLLGLFAFKLSDGMDREFIRLTNRLSPSELQIKDQKKFKKYLKYRKAFLLVSGLAIVILSMLLPN